MHNETEINTATEDLLGMLHTAHFRPVDGMGEAPDNVKKILEESLGMSHPEPRERTMTPEKIQRNREFIRDLRANSKKTEGRMRDEQGGRCCLCVAYDTAQRLGANLPDIDIGDVAPPEELARFYGWPHKNPILNNYRASMWNDGSDEDEDPGCEIEPHSHNDIAALSEARKGMA